MPFRLTQRRECLVDRCGRAGTPVAAALLAMRAPVWVAVTVPMGLQHGLSFQGIILPQMVTGVAANLVNALANYLFLYQMHLGVM